MKIGIMQPYLFPYIGYFQTINAVDKYVLYDDVNFIKQGWINRNRILLGGKDYIFNLTLAGASSFKLINEIGIIDNKAKISKTIEQAYKKAPYYSETSELLKIIFEFESDNLAVFINNSIRQICKFLNINTELIVSSNLDKDNTLKAQDKIIHICKNLNADHYVNAFGGQELYNKADFAKECIKLSFIKTKPIIYEQFKNEFVPWLSIIDVMMFNSVGDISEMLDRYELI